MNSADIFAIISIACFSVAAGLILAVILPWLLLAAGVFTLVLIVAAKALA